MRHITRILTIAGAAVAALLAQQGRIAGPVTGYVFDASSRAIRPVLGVPGASVLGDKVALGYTARTVAVSPRLDAAIVIAEDRAVHFLLIDEGAVSEVAATGLDGTAQAAVFSPNGSAAALLNNNAVQIVTGLPGAPKLRSTLSLGAQSGRSVNGVVNSRVSLRRLSIAVSDDGEYVLFAGAAAVRLLGAGGEDRVLTESASGSLVAFAPGSRDAAVADSQSGLLLLRNAAGTPVRRILAPAETVAAASGLSFSADGARLLLTNEEHAVLSFDLESGARSTIACGCKPTGLARMGRVFRLNTLDSGPLWLFDAAAAEPRTVFVPAVSAN
jgi:hypothetical protein